MSLHSQNRHKRRWKAPLIAAFACLYLSAAPPKYVYRNKEAIKILKGCKAVINAIIADELENRRVRVAVIADAYWLDPKILSKALAKLGAPKKKIEEVTGLLSLIMENPGEPFLEDLFNSIKYGSERDLTVLTVRDLEHEGSFHDLTGTPESYAQKYNLPPKAVTKERSHFPMSLLFSHRSRMENRAIDELFNLKPSVEWVATLLHEHAHRYVQIDLDDFEIMQATRHEMGKPIHPLYRDYLMPGGKYYALRDAFHAFVGEAMAIYVEQYVRAYDWSRPNPPDPSRVREKLGKDRFTYEIESEAGYYHKSLVPILKDGIWLKGKHYKITKDTYLDVARLLFDEIHGNVFE